MAALLGAALLVAVLLPAADAFRRRHERGDARELWALAAITALAAAARAIGLGDSSLEHLEATYLFEAVKPDTLLGTLFSRQAAEQMHQPLYDVILRYWAGPSVDERWIRAPSVVWAAACVPLMWTLVRDELGRGPALWTAALTAAAPLLLWYGRDATPYALLAQLSLAAVVSARQALARPSRRAHVMTAVALALAFYTHFHGGWVAITVGGWLLLAWRTHRRPVVEVTAFTALLCLPWIPALLEKLFTSVEGLNEDQPVMRYSHDLAEATGEALRLLMGSPWWLALPLIAVGAAVLVRRRSRLGSLVLVAAVVGLVAELHIVWQLSRSKGIVYVDVRHYVYLAPLLLMAAAAIPRHVGAAALLAIQVWTSAGLWALDKPDVRAASAYLARYATGPEHAVAFLPAPWYQSIVEYYLFGVCPDLVHARSHEGWWDLDTCQRLQEPTEGSIYGFPPEPERIQLATRRLALKYLWVLDMRDHRFGLPVPPTDPQERFLCWEEAEQALIRRKHFGDWVVLSVYDTARLRALPGPPPWRARPPASVTGAGAWRLDCTEVRP